MGLGIAIAVAGLPDAELSEAARVEVYERMGEVTTYRLHYEIDSAEGDLPLLGDSRLGPGSELAVIVPVGGKNHYLVKGPVTGQEIHLAHGVGGSSVVVCGADTSVVMDRETHSTLWSDVADADAVTAIVSRYGLTPSVEPTSAGHFEDKHALVQRDSDLRFVRRLARRNGYLFWVACDEHGVETAHFKRPPLEGEPAHTLSINVAGNTLEWVAIQWDVERPTSVVGAQLDLNSKADIDGAVAQSPLAALGARPLKEITMDTRSVHVVAPADDAGDLQGRGAGALAEADWFVRASCQTTLKTLNALARAHTVVALEGVGARHGGKYFVAAVRHTIDATEHRMDLELVRNGWGL